jgi:3'-5' exoribonuclease
MENKNLTKDLFIKELAEKQIIESVFLIKEKTVSQGKNGKPFMVLLLSDKTGSMDSRLWDKVDELKDVAHIGELVKVKGLIQIFQGRKQMVIHRIEKVENSSQFPMELFIVESRFDVKALFAEVMSYVSSVKNPQIQQLLKDTLEDPELKELILKSPAARSIHHAFKGGLLEHILSICKTMNFMAQHYSFLNRDFLIFGAIYHDIGKVVELSIDNGIQYTDRGRLIGHLEIGCELIDKKTSRILGFDSELRDLLKHIVLSHHGKLEFGSPKKPKFLEAVMVSMIDELDSKMDTIFQFVDAERQSGEKWSRYNAMFDRYFLLDDLNEKFK